VATPRALDETFELPETGLWTAAWSVWGADADKTAGNIINIIDALTPVERGELFGPSLRPLQVLNSGVYLSGRELLGVGIMLLRLNGIPARMSMSHFQVEYFYGKSWQILPVGGRPLF